MAKHGQMYIQEEKNDLPSRENLNRSKQDSSGNFASKLPAPKLSTPVLRKLHASMLQKFLAPVLRKFMLQNFLH